MQSYRPTSEQADALSKLVLEQKSVVVKAAPGAGKTSFFLSAVVENALPGTFLTSRTSVPRTSDAGNPTPRIIIVSYNTSLKVETTKKLAQLQEFYRAKCEDLFSSVGVMTYHGLISHYANRIVSNDLEMHTVLQEMKDGSIDVRRSKWDDVEMLLLDESQDMRLDYCHLVIYLIRQRFCSPRLRVALVGDERQLLYSMYAVNYADTRFLTMAPRYLETATEGRLQFAATVQFTRTFRLNLSGVSFANALMFAPWNSPTLQTSPAVVSSSHEDGAPVVHLVLANLYSDLTKENFGDLCPVTVLSRLQDRGLLGQTLMLFNSLNSRSVAKKVVQAATRAGIPLLVEASGDISYSTGVFSAAPPESTFEFKKHRTALGTSAQNDEVKENMVARVKTFHASKGLERLVCLMFNLKPLFPLENDVFVAATRHASELYLFQDASKISPEHLKYLQQAVPRSRLQVHMWRPAGLRDPPAATSVSSSSVSQGLSPVLAQQAFKSRKKQMYKPVENFFRFMDIQHVNSLNLKVHAAFETKPLFSVDNMYFLGGWERANGSGFEEGVDEKSREATSFSSVDDPEADAGAFVRFCDEKGPGTIGVLGNVIVLALHCFFFGELPMPYINMASAYGTEEKYCSLLKSTAAKISGEIRSGDFWVRVRQIQKLTCHLARLHIEFLASQAFEDSTVQSFDPSVCIHSTVFRRIEGAAQLLCDRMGFSRLPLEPLVKQTWQEGMLQMPEDSTVRFLTAKAFAGTQDGQSAILLRSSLKTEIEDVLEAAVASVVFKCKEALLFNVLDLSVQKIHVVDSSTEGRTSFLKEAVRAKTAEKVFFTDQQFLDRALQR